MNCEIDKKVALPLFLMFDRYGFYEKVCKEILDGDRKQTNRVLFDRRPLFGEVFYIAEHGVLFIYTSCPLNDINSGLDGYLTSLKEGAKHRVSFKGTDDTLCDYSVVVGSSSTRLFLDVLHTEYIVHVH